MSSYADVHYMQKTDVWATPQYLFDELNKEWNFTLDPCANKDNAKCAKFYTVEDDGLKQSWKGESVWCNPPYGREIPKWIVKAMNSEAEVVVFLLPVRTSTKWFHDYILDKMEVRFIKGRVKFGGATNTAPFPSMIVICKPSN